MDIVEPIDTQILERTLYRCRDGIVIFVKIERTKFCIDIRRQRDFF